MNIMTIFDILIVLIYLSLHTKNIYFTACSLIETEVDLVFNN